MEVHCTVSNCQWWDNNYCAAESILITSDAVGEELPESFDYRQTQSIVNMFGETPADLVHHGIWCSPASARSAAGNRVGCTRTDSHQQLPKHH